MTVRRTLPLACSSVVLAWVAAVLAAACSQSSEPVVASAEGTDPRIALPAGYVPESACQECHSAEHEAHAASHHARAMAVATPRSVRGRFDGTVFSSSDVTARFSMRDGRYSVRTEGGQGEPGDFAVEYTFGYEPLQQVLLALPGGRLQAFDVAWDAARERWFWLGEGEVAKPGATLHWAGPFYRWNRTCAQCHSTAVRKGFDPASGAYSTTYAATSVGCQACHGPGAAHVRWAEGDDEPPEGSSPSPLGNDTRVRRGDGTTECFPCHSHRVTLSEGWRPGYEFLDFFSPSLLHGDLYFPDGRIREEVFEYGSFLQSRMALAGVTCVDCHDAHRGAPLEPGNALCLGCHGGAPPARFAGRMPPGDFASRSHTRHSPESPGAQCASCHMPQRTYMKVDARRDHAFSIPRPDLSQRHGTPNACTSCHLGRDDAWAATTMDRWYGESWRTRPSPALAFAAAREGRMSATADLARWIEDSEAPSIVRGTALVELAALGGEGVDRFVRTAARSGEPLLRLAAAEAAAKLAMGSRLGAAGALLGDDLRAVRLAALRSLAAAATSAPLEPDLRKALARAQRDLDVYLAANADVAEAHATYGNVRFDEGRLDEAEGAFRRAIELDPGFAGAHVNLAEVLRRTGREGEALRVVSDALERIPGSAELHYGQGLAWVRARRVSDAADAFARAQALAPDEPRYALAHALALEALGRFDEARREAESLVRLRPEDPAAAALVRRLPER